jgi:serine/threonine-protein kinase RsbW
VATVDAAFTPLFAHVRTARLVATAVARRSGVPESLLDEVRLAVGEACSRAVEAHQLHCPAEPVRIALTEYAGRFEIEVINSGQAVAPTASSGPDSADLSAWADGDGDFGASGLSIAVIAGLADDVKISQTAAGTSITMSWPSSGPVRGGPPA